MSQILDDTNLAQVTKRMPSNSTIETIMDSEGLSWDIPFSGSYDQWSTYSFKMGGVELFRMAALGDGGGGIAQSIRFFLGPVEMTSSLYVYGFVTSDSGFNTSGNNFYVDETGYMIVQFIENVSGMTCQRNITIGGFTPGASANKVLVLGDDATEPVTFSDVVQIFAKDISVGHATLAVATEESVQTDAALVSTHSLVGWFNHGGTMKKFKIPLILI